MGHANKYNIAAVTIAWLSRRPRKVFIVCSLPGVRGAAARQRTQHPGFANATRSPTASTQHSQLRPLPIPAATQTPNADSKTRHTDATRLQSLPRLHRGQHSITSAARSRPPDPTNLAPAEGARVIGCCFVVLVVGVLFELASPSCDFRLRLVRRRHCAQLAQLREVSFGQAFARVNFVPPVSKLFHPCEMSAL